MDISIIIVNYKSKDKALKSIQAVRGSETGGLANEIILVDNASGGGNADAIRTAFPDMKIIESDRNLGMGAGNNLGIKAAAGKYILVLNPDTYLEKNTLKSLYAYLDENPDVGIVGPKLFYPDGKLQVTCFRFPKPYTFLLRRTFLGCIFKQALDDYLMADYDRQSVKEVDWIMGSCFLLRRSVLGKIGGAFDERFWMYFEDTDLCRRVQNAGYKVVYYPQASAVHDHGRGSAKNPWYIAPFKDRLARAHIFSWAKFFWKWGMFSP